jgi:hypothetical protein
MQKWMAQLLGAAATALVLLVHARAYVADPAFWAEDLRTFWLDEFQHGISASLLTPYAGYLHLVPRLIAWVAWSVPIAVHPVFFVAIAFGLTVWTGSLIAASADRAGAGIAMAIALVAVPDSGEVWLTPTNLQWVLACALPVFFGMPTPTSVSVRIQQAVFVVLAGLSGPFMILAAPLWAAMLWSAWRAREFMRFSTFLAALAAAMACIQATVLLLVNTALGGRGGLSGAIASLTARWHSEVVPEAILVAAIIGGLLVLALLPRERRGTRIGFVLFGALVLVSSAAKLGSEVAGIRPVSAGDRYFYVPIVMAAFSMISVVWSTKEPKLRAVVPAALVVLGAILAAAVLTPISPRMPADSTREWQAIADKIGKEPLSVTIPPQWTIDIPAQQ